MTDVWRVPADDGSGELEITPVVVVSGGVAEVSAAITAWLEDEQERQGFNVPDSYLTWFDHDELAAALTGGLDLQRRREDDDEV